MWVYGSLNGVLGCGGDAGSPGDRAHPEPSAAADAPTQTPSPADDGPFRFVPTLEQHLPAGAVAEPVLELSQPRQRAVVVVAAVLRAGSEHVELERWTFEQNPDGESLRMIEGGEALLRLRPGTRHPKLVDLRRALAAPRVVLTRPLGLDVLQPRAAIETVAAALATMRDPKAEPRARVRAAATVVQGLDDTVVFDRDAIWQLADLLDPMPAAIEVKPLSDRRAQATIERPGGTATLELQRKSDGWTIAALAVPEAAPTPDGAETGPSATPPP